MKKYCIVRKTRLRWEAYNEDARMICHSVDYRELRDKLDNYGYEVVSTRSRFGATILDKLGIVESIIGQLLSREPKREPTSL